jgi:membrane protein implicated in regulation of membrane protease activity
MLMIVAIGWMYVVLMMALTEHSFIAGVMTFLLYGLFPLSVVLYLLGTRQRRERRAYRERQARLQAQAEAEEKASAPQVPSSSEP